MYRAVLTPGAAHLGINSYLRAMTPACSCKHTVQCQRTVSWALFTSCFGF